MILSRYFIGRVPSPFPVLHEYVFLMYNPLHIIGCIVVNHSTVNSAYNELLGTMRNSSLYPVSSVTLHITQHSGVMYRGITVDASCYNIVCLV